MFPVIRGASYVLIHAPHLLVSNGTTQTMEKKKNPESTYLKKLPEYLRPFEEVTAYPPNQVYIGNFEAGFLEKTPRPWYQNQVKDANRFGPYGEIMPEDEFFGIMKNVDSFDLVHLEDAFAQSTHRKLTSHPLFDGHDLSKILKTTEKDAIDRMIVDIVLENEGE